MKRSVAILGPTPSFVRWAIWHDCPLRELEESNLADQTFRQLRALRELSLGFNQGRVRDGICVHSDAEAADIDAAMGFSVEEILEFFGTKSSVDDCCLDCPANSLAKNGSPTWAGCYGWLPAKDFVFAEVPRSLSDTFDLISLVAGALASDQALQKRFEATCDLSSPVWFGIWKSKVLRGNQLVLLKELFELVLERAGNSGEERAVLSSLTQFVGALTCCVEGRLNLHVELMPSGFSDGQTWEIHAHCPDCKMTLLEKGRQFCPVCERVGAPAGGKKSRVLGLRPFVHLTGIIGREKTEELLNAMVES